MLRSPNIVLLLFQLIAASHIYLCRGPVHTIKLSELFSFWSFEQSTNHEYAEGGGEEQPLQAT